MPIPQLKRRSYGFVNRPNSAEPKPSAPTISSDNAEKGDPERFLKKNITPTRPNGRWLGLLFGVLTAVARIFYWFLVRLGQLVVFFYKKMPRVSKPTRVKWRKKIIWSALSFMVLGFLAGTIFVAWASKDLPDPDRLTERQVAQSTKIYDRTGEHLLYEIFADQKRTLVEIDEIPQNLINAAIATEDKDFYEHRGVKMRSFARAAFYGIFTSKRTGGTSTLTQQLVKNAILTKERSYIRKLKEIILSIRLEQKYSKEQILKIYFNEIPYGSTNYGVEAASRSYFGKSVSELNLAESATLAGLPKAPSKYLNDPEALKERRDFVLRRMSEEGYITEEQKTATQAEPLALERRFGEMQAPHFSLYVKEQLVARYGEQAVDTGGYNVITTLDWEKQKAAEDIVRDLGAKVLADAGANNTSLVALDPKTGEILAMIGSRNFNDEEIDGQFNVATLGKRQPGSSFKPIVYAAAFEKGYTPETVLFDVVTNFAASGEPYRPLNFDLKERGPVTMRQAMQGSLNIPAVQTLYLVGPKKGVEFAERLGYTTLSEGTFGLSLVLGDGEVKLLEHVAAYGVFANGGTYRPPVSILRVEDSRGDVLFEQKKNNGAKVLDDKIAALISNVLSDDASRAYIFGAGGALTLPGRPVAAKTGTTNNYVDAWTVGYTPSLVAGVWAGNTNNTPMKGGYGGNRVAAELWHAFMAEVLKDTLVENFPAPPPNETKKPVLRGSAGGNITLKINLLTNKIATSSTPPDLIIEKTYLQPHSILQYVNKDDPNGPAPENPNDDPQYAIWEAAIQDWIGRKKEKEPDWNISFEEPPTEEDDAYSLELIPALEVLSPQPNSILTSRQIITDIRASAPRGISRAMYQIDGKKIATVEHPPFNLNLLIRDLASGAHTLIIVVEDDIGNRRQESIPFTLEAGPVLPSVYWGDVKQSYSSSDFPLAFFLKHVMLDQLRRVSVHAQKEGGERLTIATISDFSQLFNDFLPFTWNEYPGAGSWSLLIEIETAGGGTFENERVNIRIE